MLSSKKLLLGVVGCGRVFERYHLPAVLRSTDWKLAALCEPLKERREWISSIYGELPAFDSYQEFLKYSPLEAVLITTPPATHCSLSVMAFEAGLHVMVEKPSALNLEDAKKLLTASQRNKRQLQVGFNRRFNRYYLELKKKLSLIPHDRIKSISAKLTINPKIWNAVTSFYGKDSEGGGVIDDVASHQIDLVPWLLDDDVESVVSSIATKRGEVDAQYLTYELMFGKGLVARCEAGHGPNYLENIEVQLENKKFLVYPTGFFELHRLPTNLIHNFSKLRTFLHFSIHKFGGKPNVTLKSIEKQLNAFAAAVRGDTDVLLGADARSGVHTLQIIEACRKSIQSGGSRIELIY